jgi:protein phosphatase
MVVAPQIWLDTTPGRSPVPMTEEFVEVPEVALPYLHLIRHSLHLPTVFGVHTPNGGTPILLLDNAPIDPAGLLQTTLTSAWEQAPALRQLYWLWQLLDLWEPLQQEGVVASLLRADNVHVEGWRIRLRELFPDSVLEDPTAPTPSPENTGDRPQIFAPLHGFAEIWQALAERANPDIQPPLLQLCGQMTAQAQSATGAESTDASFLSTLRKQLNHLLLTHASHQPLRLTIAGGTTTGPQHSHNEDTCYPDTMQAMPSQPDDMLLLPRFAIVCDGIGGHEGGEVASQLAVRSLKLQMCAFLTELAEQNELLSPEVVIQQLEAILRVVNNLIASQNDSQGRESRQRMGTTVVMALQLPQQVNRESAGDAVGESNSHELYIAHVGDSRAYWLTSRYCHQLTVDDDIATRDVGLGRTFLAAIAQRPDAGALTQALGTRDGELLKPSVKRFILDEDGIVLLCSDGLSDNGWIEQLWEHSTRLVLKGKMTLPLAVQTWLDLANQRNGHDNSSVVMLHCQTSRDSVKLFDSRIHSSDTELSDSARALLYDEDPDTAIETDADIPEPATHKASMWISGIGLAIACFIAGILGIMLWKQLDPEGFQRLQEQLQPQPESVTPSP